MKKFLLYIITLFFVTGAMAQYNVTFQVDLNALEDFDPLTTEVYIAGDFLDWNQPGTNPDYKMTPNSDDPMIYEFVYGFEDGEHVVNFKFFFVYDETPSWDNGEWTGDPNRLAVFIGEGTATYIWGDKPFAVTFNVDMTNATEFDPVTDEIFIGGSLANVWAQPGTIQYYKMMPVITDDAMIYSINLLLYAGDYMYKYFRVIDSLPSWDNGEWPGDPNREVSVADEMEVNNVWAQQDESISELGIDVISSVYPNPCQSYVNLALNNNIRDIRAIEVFNILGEMVISLEDVSLQKEYRIYTGNLNTGVYFITLRTKDGYQAARFVKE